VALKTTDEDMMGNIIEILVTDFSEDKVIIRFKELTEKL